MISREYSGMNSGMALKGQNVLPQRHTCHLTVVIGGNLLGAGRHGHHLILM
jgi:hypothetical protein